MHAEPMRDPARHELAKMLIRQGNPSRARSILSGLLETQSQERSDLAKTLMLSAVALALSSDDELGAEEALKEAQRAVFLAPGSSEARKVLEFCRTRPTS